MKRLKYFGYYSYWSCHRDSRKRFEASRFREEALNAPDQMQTREEMRRVRPTKTKITKVLGTGNHPTLYHEALNESSWGRVLVENFTLEELAKKLLSLLKEYQAHRIPQGPIIGVNKAWRHTRLSFRASGN